MKKKQPTLIRRLYDKETSPWHKNNNHYNSEVTANVYSIFFFFREHNTFAKSFAHYSKEGDDKDIIFLVFLTSGEIRVGLVELH